MSLPRKGTLRALAYIPKASPCYPPSKSSELILHPTEEEMTKNRRMGCVVLKRQRLSFVYPKPAGLPGFYIIFFFNTIGNASFAPYNSKLVFYVVMTYIRGF